MFVWNKLQSSYFWHAIGIRKASPKRQSWGTACHVRASYALPFRDLEWHQRWQEKKNEPTRAHTIPSLDKPAMRLYGIFSTVEGPWGAGGGMTWTDEDVSAASHLEMAFPVR